MDFRKHLATIYRACRKIAQFTTVYSFETKTEEAKIWRQEVCYRTILLLWVTMDALLWSSTERENWENEYFMYNPAKDKDDYISDHFFHFRQLAHGRRSYIDENFRAPITFQHLLRCIIMEHPKYLGYELAVKEYRDLLNFVTIFNNAFHSFRMLIFTPYPFPLCRWLAHFYFLGLHIGHGTSEGVQVVELPVYCVAGDIWTCRNRIRVNGA